jgi:hypothetical protein
LGEHAFAGALTTQGENHMTEVVYDGDADLSIIQNVKVCKEPIGVTYDNESEQAWVACYEGSIKVFQN